MHKKWSTKQMKMPDLKYFPSESDGFLNKRSTKKGAPLHHNAALYADDSAFIFLSKAHLIAGTILVSWMHQHSKIDVDAAVSMHLCRRQCLP
jgi:hypothetical protein